MSAYLLSWLSELIFGSVDNEINLSDFIQAKWILHIHGYFIRKSKIFPTVRDHAWWLDNWCESFADKSGEISYEDWIDINN